MASELRFSSSRIGRKILGRTLGVCIPSRLCYVQVVGRRCSSFPGALYAQTTASWLALFGFAVSLAAGQHAAVSVAAPPVVVRAVPTGQLAAAHVLPPHSPTHAHSGSNVGVPVHSSIVSSHRSGNPPLPVHTIPPAPLGGSVNPITAGPSFCNRRGSGLVGLNACPPTTGVVLPFFGGSVYVPIPYYADASAPADQEPPKKKLPTSRRRIPILKRANRICQVEGPPRPVIVRAPMILLNRFRSLCLSSAMARRFTRLLTASLMTSYSTSRRRAFAGQ